MHFVTDQDEFRREWALVENALNLNQLVHEGVFRQRPIACHFTEFGFIQRTELFVDIQSLLTRLGDSQCSIMPIRPDPLSYYFSRLGRFQLLKITRGDASNDYIRAINDGPGGSPADSLTSHVEVVGIYSNPSSWFFYGDHDSRLVVLAFFTKDAEEAFLSLPLLSNLLPIPVVLEELSKLYGQLFSYRRFLDAYNITDLGFGAQSLGES